MSLLIGCGAPSENAASSDPSAANGQGDASSDGSPVVNVYSSRHYDVDDEVYESFTRETGIKVNLIESDSAALLERIKREGDQSPADVFVTVDAGRLYQAQQEGIFDPVTSEILTERIPANLRHPEGLWFGLTKRARVIMIAKDRVESGAITRYEDLANPKWQGKVLIRSSSNIYNQSLMGSIIAAAEEKGAEAWCRGLVANMARPPQGGDRDQIRAVAAGEGDIAVANTYYLAAMMVGSPEDQAAAAKVQPIFPNQDNRGAHVNISGAGVVKGAPNRANAIRFLEHLTSEQAQEKFAGANKEYPVVAGVALAPELEGFGEFREDDLNASVFGASNQQALMLMDRCGWR
ncbi:MAG: Fe(3+) ABC transporter substrate-binding protein [Acidobacteriota bacterium]